AEQVPQVLGGRYTRRELRDLSVGVAEPGEDRLDDRGVVEMEGWAQEIDGRGSGSDQGRDEGGGDSDTESLEFVVVVDRGRRGDVVVEPPVLVIGDDQERLRPSLC